ncbi:LamB-type porin [Vibrio phage 1.084.O._10N.261.49.F5]|nr:LamB-type porin [Vibrio phage 1.084.O._10N.261.49.F5]
MKTLALTLTLLLSALSANVSAETATLEQSIVKAEKRLSMAVQRQNDRMSLAIAKRQLTCKKENN